MPNTATYPKYPSHALVTVYPFEQRAEGDEVIIANRTQSSFLCVPPEAVDLLESLASGQTVGEAEAEYQRKYGVTPDLDDFLDMLAAEGFLKLKLKPKLELEPELKLSDTEQEHEVNLAPPAASALRYHFQDISVDVARRLFSPMVLIVSGVLIGLGGLACVLDPALLPPPTALVFDRDQVGLLAAVLLVSLVSVFIHELAHLVAARAAGVPSRIGVGNRLWMLVAETDMTGMWMASRAQRCLAFLAGPLVDLASSAGLVLVLFGDRQHWVQLDPALVLVIRACLFQYLARLLWQFEFYVATDFYYVVGAVFGCKSLLQDTQTDVLNQLARVVPRIQTRDQSAVPHAELRVVRWFAVFWLLGRGVAFGTLVWITLPVLVGYAVVLAKAAVDEGAVASTVEGPMMPLIVVAVQAIGLAMWIRGSGLTRRSA